MVRQDEITDPSAPKPEDASKPPTALQRKPALTEVPEPLPPDEDGSGDTLVLNRQKAGAPAGSLPRHVRPTVPLRGMPPEVQEGALAEDVSPVAKPPPQAPLAVPAPPAGRAPTPTVGMRRAVAGASGLVLVIAGAVGWFAYRAHSVRADPVVEESARQPVPVPVPTEVAAPSPSPAPPVTSPPVAAPPPETVVAAAPPAPVLPEPVATKPPPADPAAVTRAAAREASRGTGTLRVKVKPWAQVVIDGKRKGEVQGMQAYRLPAGKHHLRFEHPRETREYDVAIGANAVVEQEYILTK